MPRFIFYNQADLTGYLKIREGEVKLGERCVTLPEGNWVESLRETDASFVVLGLPEDAGVRANGGIGGTQTAWEDFLSSFLNIQHNTYLQGSRFILLGELQTDDLPAGAAIEQLREYTGKIDDVVFPLIKDIVASGKIPVVIGGGHNNAFPILKGTSLAFKQPVNALNLDAHTDYRSMEGRHSGNGFRYARHHQFLARYAVLGWHENYNGENILREFGQDPDLMGVSWEDIFLREKIGWDMALVQCMAHVSNGPFGVELDADAIENVLSSAATPVGISADRAMTFLYRCGQHRQATYLHLPEAISRRADSQSRPLTGKLLSYLVQAFCKGVGER